MSISKVKSLAKDSIIYGFSGIISRMITVFLVPVYTRIFHPHDYGIINLVNTTFFLVGILAVCGLDSAAGRWFYDTNESVDRKKTFASWFWLQLLVTVAFICTLFLTIPIFANYLIKINIQDLWPIWLLACATLITNILPLLIWNWYRLNRKPKETMIFTLSQSVVTIGLTILFVVVLKWHILGVYVSLFISSFLFSIIAILQLKDWLSFSYFDKKRLREMLNFSIPLVPAAIAFWVINSANAYFIQMFSGKTEVGLFSVGASIASAVTLFTSAFTQAWGPFAFSIINEPDAKKTYANVFFIFGILSSLVILGMFLFSPEILQILTAPQYHQSAWVTSILSINFILIAFSYIASIGLNIVKNSTYFMKAILLASAITVLLNFVFIPLWGKEGSALATVLAQIIVPVYLFYQAQKLYPINFPFAKVTILVLSAVLLGIAVRFLVIPDAVILFIIKVSVFILFGLAIFYFTLNLRQKLLSKIKFSF